MGSREMGSGPLDQNQNDPSPADSGELSERLADFWLTLPHANRLRSQSLVNIQHRKSSNYLAKTLQELVGIADQAEEDERKSRKKLEDAQQKKLNLHDKSRFLAGDFTESRLNLPLDTYLSSMPKSWGAESASLKDYLSKRPKPLAPIPSPKGAKKVSKGDDWVSQFRQSMENIKQKAPKKTINGQRRKELRMQIADFDLINRPMHYLRTEKSDNLEEGASLVPNFHESLQNPLSKETLTTLLESEIDPEPQIDMNEPDDLDKFSDKSLDEGNDAESLSNNVESSTSPNY